MSKQVYLTEINTKTDVETLKAILKIYLTSYELNYKVRVRPKLVDTLVIYMMHGISEESDKIIAKMRNVPLKNIRVDKNALKNLKLVEQSGYNNRKSKLRTDLIDLVTLFNNTKDSNGFISCFTFKNNNN